MIRYVQRKNLDLLKYDVCIKNAIQSRIYAFSWYLDCVTENWGVLVLNDYEAVMPIPWRRKFGIKYVYPPFWILELGVFSKTEEIKAPIFLKYLLNKFKFVELRLNSHNEILPNESYQTRKQFQFLELKKNITENYKKERKKDLRKAKVNNLKIEVDNNPSSLITLFKNNVGKRIPNISDKDYSILKKLITICMNKNKGEILSVYNHENKLVASGFFIKHKKTITILISSTDFKNRNNGANTFLIDTAIQKHQKTHTFFNFGGSSIKTVAHYFMSFGSETKEYSQIKSTNFDSLLKLIKY